MRTDPSSGFSYLAVFVGIAVGLVLLALMTPCQFKAIDRAKLAEALNNIRQVKFALDGYAIDHDGQFPDVQSATGSYSNDYFRPLLLDGETQSEKIFWSYGSPVANPNAPDDKIKRAGKLEPSIVLQAGDVHWAYVTGQRTDEGHDRPLLLDPFLPGTTKFDPDLWHRKAIVLRVDGSARALRMSLEKDTVRDDSGHELFSPKAEAWKGSGLDPMLLLKQPRPNP